MRKYFLAFSLTLVTGMASAEENASNPLAAAKNIDLRWQYTSADPGDKHDVYVDGAYMVLPVLKLKYELHYNFTDVTGSDENDFEKLVIKPIYFPYQTKLSNDWGLRAAVVSIGPSSSATKTKVDATPDITMPELAEALWNSHQVRADPARLSRHLKHRLG